MGVLSTGASGTSANDIRALIAQREQARGNKDWVTSDRIREDLRAKGVEVLDKERLWKSSDGSVGIIDPANGAAPTDEAITSLVGKREEARTMRDWATSDAIRDELRAHGVELQDKEKTWRVRALHRCRR